MSKILVASFLSLAAAAGLQSVRADPPEAAPTNAPAAPAPAAAPKEDASAQPPMPEPDRSGINPDLLPVVRRIVAHPQTWQQGVEQAMATIKVPALKTEVMQGFDMLAPRIAKGLLERQGRTAFATVATYLDGQGNQAAVAISFDGFDDRLDATFYGRVLAGLPGVPPSAQTASTTPLRTDPRASWHLCFYLDKAGLGAAGIPQAQLKEEVAAAFKARQAQIASAAAAPAAPQEAPAVAQEAPPATATPPNSDDGNENYPTQPYYYGEGGLYGWGAYNPLVYVPGRSINHDWANWRQWNWNGYRLARKRVAGQTPAAGTSPQTPTETTGTTGVPNEPITAGQPTPAGTGIPVQATGGNVFRPPTPTVERAPADRRETPAAGQAPARSEGPAHAGGAPAGGGAAHSGGTPAGGGGRK